MGRTEFGRVAAKDAAAAAKPERGDVFANERARGRAIVDEQHERRAVRGRLDPERAGTGEQIEHARAGDRIAIGVQENVEQRFAQAIGGRADCVRFRAGERAPAQPSADDAHQSVIRESSPSDFRSGAGNRFPAFAKPASAGEARSDTDHASLIT